MLQTESPAPPSKYTNSASFGSKYGHLPTRPQAKETHEEFSLFSARSEPDKLVPVIHLGILGSGSGSNMQAILDAIRDNRLDAKIVLVLTDNPDAYILTRAKDAGIPTQLIDCRGYASRLPDQSQQETADALKKAGADLVCLAGFMRLVKPPLLTAFPNRILNIHPSLLPNYPGLEAWTQAVEDKATESGCTVHYVDAGMDTGPIIAQAKVPVLPDDTPDSLHQRIQVAEHRLYPEAILKVAESLPATQP